MKSKQSLLEIKLGVGYRSLVKVIPVHEILGTLKYFLSGQSISGIESDAIVPAYNVVRGLVVHVALKEICFIHRTSFP